MNEPDQIAPGVAVLDNGDWSLPLRRPDPAQERLQPDAVLVGRPQLDSGLGEDGRHRLHERP